MARRRTRPVMPRWRRARSPPPDDQKSSPFRSPQSRGHTKWGAPRFRLGTSVISAGTLRFLGVMRGKKIMTIEAQQTLAAGWYPDPAQSGGDRWWDGTAWTDHIRVE